MNRTAFRGAKVLITGASAGLGRALTLALAAPGVDLGLVARRAEPLAEVGAAAQALGARVWSYPADVGDAAAMRQAAGDFVAQAGGVTHAFANAGISEPDRVLQGDPTVLGELMRINVIGVINTLLPLVPSMVRQGRGHLVAISSVASFRALPGKGGYCASKGAVNMLMDGFRPRLRPHGIRVSTICPGFIATALTARNAYPMPFMLSAERAAELTLRAVARGRRQAVFPWQMRLIAPLLRRMPDFMLPAR
ncbi:MAG: SDR family NAD(P)-dependent oxidoreductase [Candidatus Lambdaproteobacteria bacterium]|nr:SDR family NAD(P)-dependent oxidoreductase [Candidatus Lambdaproteobacteria bacterium]